MKESWYLEKGEPGDQPQQRSLFRIDGRWYLAVHMVLTLSIQPGRGHFFVAAGEGMAVHVRLHDVVPNNEWKRMDAPDDPDFAAYPPDAEWLIDGMKHSEFVYNSIGPLEETTGLMERWRKDPLAVLAEGML